MNRLKSFLCQALICGALITPANASDTLDPCLVGLWRADLDDMAHVYSVQMNASSVTATGDVRMRIYDNGNGNMSVQNLSYDMIMEAMPPMTVSVTGDNSFTIRTLDMFAYFEPEGYDLVARAEVLGMVIDVPFTDGSMFVAQNSTGEFGCTEDSLSFEMAEIGKIPRKWYRLPVPGDR